MKGKYSFVPISTLCKWECEKNPLVHFCICENVWPFQEKERQTDPNLTTVINDIQMGIIPKATACFKRALLYCVTVSI